MDQTGLRKLGREIEGLVNLIQNGSNWTSGSGARSGGFGEDWGKRPRTVCFSVGPLSYALSELKKERFSFGDFSLLAATLGTTQGLLGIFEFFYREKRKPKLKPTPVSFRFVFFFLIYKSMQLFLNLHERF